ncbi:IclR family transcriptional regulator [bacterium]|nr:IclR family transcriptional regulator [bacterium]
MTIQSVQRALEILSLFSVSNPQLGIADISRGMGLAKPTVHGLVQTLVEQRFLQKNPETRKYSLGFKIYELGTYLSSTLRINQAGTEIVRRLAQKNSNWARIGIWDNNSVLVTLNYFPNIDYLQFQQLGPRVPAYCSALGKAILFSLPETELNEYLSQIVLNAYTEHTITDKKKLKKEIQKMRSQGFAAESEEYMLGLSCISCPVFDSSRKVAGAVSLTINVDLIEKGDYNRIVKETKQNAMEISRRMGYVTEILPM